MTYLLQKGADPSLKDYMAVEIAVSMKDLKMVKLLIEREQSGFGTTRTGDESESPTKKMKLGDRITVPAKMVESAMKKGTKDIVNYLVYDKSESYALFRYRPSFMSVYRGHSSTIFHHGLGQAGCQIESQNQTPVQQVKKEESRVPIESCEDKAVAIYNYVVL